jgi:pyruvate dehydrogenase E1 component
VILAHTKKGYGMGAAGQGKMTTHSQKKLDESALLEFRNRFNLPLSDEQAKNLDFFKPAEDSAEMRYLHRTGRRWAATMPQRQTQCDVVPVPAPPATRSSHWQAGGKEMSTTMAFVRLLGNLLKDPALGPRIVPIVADEARTFGMANLFKQVGIYSSAGQSYEPEDIGSVLSYREALDGQILEEGISEAGAIASWTAAATSYSVHGHAMLPSTSTTRCSASSAWAMRSGPRPTSARAASCWAPPRAAPRWAAKACSTRTAAATWWPRPSPTARPTTRPSPARWR